MRFISVQFCRTSAMFITIQRQIFLHQHSHLLLVMIGKILLCNDSVPNTAPDERRDAARRAPDLRTSAGAMVVGVCAFFRQIAWLGVGSGKVALSRPGRAPGWCPIPPTSPHQGARQYPEGTYPTWEDHPRAR